MKSEAIKVLAFSGCYLPGYKAGGPIKTLRNLFNQAGMQLKFQLITRDRDLGDDEPYENVRCGAWNKVGNADVFYTQAGLKGYLQMLRILWRKEYDILYLNSFFSVRFSLFPLLIGKVLHQRIVLGPRGEFSQGALSLKSRKKKLFIKIYKFLKLERKIIFQASSEFEAADIRAVIGGSSDIYVAEDVGSQEFAESIAQRESGAIRIIFVSRISPMKNLHGALEMLRSVSQPVAYHVYGPIEDVEYWALCQALVAELPAHVEFSYKGVLAPAEVVPVMSSYDLFFMPTKGENYGHVIAEAMCSGLPILIADTTPWRNLEEQGIGWDLSLNDPHAFSAAIDYLAVLPSYKHHQMRVAVLAWAKKRFSQRAAVDSNIAMFSHAFQKTEDY